MFFRRRADRAFREAQRAGYALLQMHAEWPLPDPASGAAAPAGCPVLEKLGAEAATGTGLDFSRKAKASFTYADGSSSEISEELYSDTAAKLSNGIGKIFDAMASCPTYQVVSGSTVIDMETQETAAPDLGDEQWSQLLTYLTGGQRSVVKQTAIRTGNVLVIVSGSPGLVDANLEKALAKAEAAH